MAMAEWKCLTAAEERLVRSLGADPSHMMVNRVGEGHLHLLDMRTRDELLVTIPEKGPVTATWERSTATPPRRAWA